MRNRNNTKRLISILFAFIIVTLLVSLLIDLNDYIIVAINNKSWKPVLSRFQEYGIKAPIVFSLLQFFTVLITVLPAGPLQIISGITIGPLFGIISTFIGVFLGNMLLYLLARVYGKSTDKFYTDTGISDLLEQNNPKSKLKILILLYFIPIIPYGFIAYTLAKSKVKFRNYFLITSLSIIPYIFLNSYFGYLITQTNMILSVTIACMLLISTIIFSTSQYQIAHYLTNRPLKDMDYFRSHVRKPQIFLYTVARFLFHVFIKYKVNYRVDKKSLNKLRESGVAKGAFLLLYNHPSVLDWGYAYIPLFPRRVNSIIAFAYFCNYKLGRLLHFAGGFPKYLYRPDISSIKNIKKVINRGDILGMAPEGRLSAYGSLEKLAPGVEKLIKHLEVPVVFAKIQGGYLTKPKWAKRMKKGRVVVSYEKIFTTEFIKKSSLDEISTHLNDKFQYDEFEWQAKEKIYWKGKDFAVGLENILYICPVCHHEYTTETKGSHIYCTNCKTDVILNNYYEFESSNKLIPKNIKEWYLFQKELELENIHKEGFNLESNVTLKLPDPNGEGFIEVGVGKTILTTNGLKYTGTINGVNTEVFIERHNIAALPFGANEDFEVYYNKTMYYFIPENKRASVKYSIIAELIFNKYEKDIM